MGRMSIRYHGTGTLANRVKGKVDKARAKISMRLFATWRRAIIPQVLVLMLSEDIEKLSFRIDRLE